MKKNQIQKKQKRQSLLFVIMAVCFVLLATGCRNREEAAPTDTDGETKIYFLNEDGSKIVGEAYEFRSSDPEKQMKELIAALELEPQTEGYRQAKPEEVVLTEYSLASNGLLTLQFDAAYQQVTGVAEVLMRAAIVKTLCQSEAVGSVEFYVAGQPLMRLSGKPVGMMKAEDFIDNTGANTEFYQNAYVSIYFSNEAGDALVESNLKITYDGTIPTEQLVLNQLLKGPIEDGMRSAIPEGTVLNKVSVKDGVCYVDFNEKFMEKRSDVTEEVTIYSVVNSLAELSNIYKVQFTINGETKKTYQVIDLTAPMERNLEIIDGEQ